MATQLPLWFKRRAQELWRNSRLHRFPFARRFLIVRGILGRAVHTVACVAAMICACDVDAASPLGVTITATGYEVFEPVISIAWIDNTRLLFAGSKSIGPDASRASFESTKLYLWDDVAKTARVYAEATAFCYTNGKIRYGVRAEKNAGKQIVREGPLGSEREIEKPLRLQGMFSKFTCKRHPPDELAPPAHDRFYVVLKEGDGYIDKGPRQPKERLAHPRNLILYPANQRKAIQLPITWDEQIGGVAGDFGIAYSMYRRAYVLPPQVLATSGKLNWPPEQPRGVYLLWADGKVERISIPPIQGFLFPRPVKSGWLYGGGDTKTAGLHLFDGHKVIRVDAGGVKEIDVNANGCRAAVAINNKYRDMGTPVNLKIFDFCRRED